MRKQARFGLIVGVLASLSLGAVLAQNRQESTVVITGDPLIAEIQPTLQQFTDSPPAQFSVPDFIDRETVIKIVPLFGTTTPKKYSGMLVFAPAQQENAVRVLYLRRNEDGRMRYRTDPRPEVRPSPTTGTTTPPLRLKRIGISAPDWETYVLVKLDGISGSPDDYRGSTIFLRYKGRTNAYGLVSAPRLSALSSSPQDGPQGYQ